MPGSFLDHPSVQQILSEDEELSYPPIDLNPTEELIRTKLVHTLSMYPGISRAMLQVGIGPSVSPAMWDPVFDKMVAGKQIVVEQETAESPAGRMQSYKHIRLAPGVVLSATK